MRCQPQIKLLTFLAFFQVFVVIDSDAQPKAATALDASRNEYEKRLKEKPLVKRWLPPLPKPKLLEQSPIPNTTASIDPDTGFLTTLKGVVPLPGARSAEEATKLFIATYGELFGMKKSFLM